MSLRQHPTTRIFHADIRDRRAGRVHISLKTTRRPEAETRMVAVRELVREGDASLIADLRARRINIEALARCYRDRRPFSELRPAPAWPTLAAASKQYLRWIEHHPRRSAGTLQQARMLMRQAVAFFGASTPVNTITPERVTEYRTDLEGRALAPNTVRAKLDRVGAFYNWLEKQEAGASRKAGRAPKPLYSPVDPEMIPAKGEPRVRFLSTDEATLLAAAQIERLGAERAGGRVAVAVARGARGSRGGVGVALPERWWHGAGVGRSGGRHDGAGRGSRRDGLRPARARRRNVSRVEAFLRIKSRHGWRGLVHGRATARTFDDGESREHLWPLISKS